MNPIFTTLLASALSSYAIPWLTSNGLHLQSGDITTLVNMAGVGLATLAAHWTHRKLAPSSATPPAVVAAIAQQPAAIQAEIAAAVIKPTVPASAVSVLFALALGGAFLMPGCASAPSAQEESTVTVAVDLAAGLAIQQGTQDPAVWKTRATNFKAIALSLQTVNNAGTATLATLAADLQPMVVKLGPADVLAANALVAALQPYLSQYQTTSPNVANTQAHVALILTAVINACTAYGA